MPEVEKDVFIAKGAKVIGKVQLGTKVNVWFNAILRGDEDRIVIGDYTNVQDNTVVHCNMEEPTIVGKYVTLGHRVLLHACKIEDYCLIGMGAIILDGAEIGEGSIIGAGTVVTPGTKIPPFSLVLGTPGRVIKRLEESTITARKKHAEKYYERSQDYIE